MINMKTRVVLRDRFSYSLDMIAENNEEEAVLIKTAGRCPVLISWSFKTKPGSVGRVAIDIALRANSTPTGFPDDMDWINHEEYGHVDVNNISVDGGDWDVDLPPWMRMRTTANAVNTRIEARLNLWSMEKLQLFDTNGNELLGATS